MFKLINYEINDKGLTLNVKLKKMDYLEEFSKDFLSNSIDKIRYEINKLIKKHKINFVKGKISILINGTLLFTLFFNGIGQNKVNKLSQIETSYQDSLIDYSSLISSSNHSIGEEKLSESSIEEIIINSSTLNTTIPSNSNKEELDYMVTLKRNDNEIIELFLEEYLIGVVAGEMPASFEQEALKAQAVVSRSYAMKRVLSGIILFDTTANQVYRDEQYLKNLWGSNYDYYLTKIKNAVESTKKEVITYDGKIIDALFHARNGGYTEEPQNVWVNSLPYLKSKESPYDAQLKNNSKTTIITYKELTSKLNKSITSNSTIKLFSKNGYVSLMNIDGINYKGVDIRSKFKLNSTNFKVNKTSTGIQFITIGYGHGVGMSQYGANEMAKDKKNYEQIINFYYTGIMLQNSI